MFIYKSKYVRTPTDYAFQSGECVQLKTWMLMLCSEKHALSPF